MPSKQVILPGLSFSSRLSFGGDLLVGRRKSARVFDSKRALHVVLRSSRCTGALSLKKFDRKIVDILNRQSRLHSVRVYARANAGNHLHLVLKAPTRRALKGFLRATSGLIARKVSGRERGSTVRCTEVPASNRAHDSAQALPRSGFWDARPFSRIVNWGKDFTKLKNYLHFNRLEALGFARHESRGILDVCRQFGLDPPIA